VQVKAQLFINEICSTNYSNQADEDGNYEDWIELYNNSDAAINLSGYTLTDNPDLPEKWTFPSVTIAPYEFIVVFASGKNRDRVINHFETVISATDTFCYISPLVEPDPAWRTPEYDDSDWQKGPGGFGFGEGLYNTTIPDSLVSVYLRKEFELTDKSKIVNALFHIDYDDGFIAFINDYEIFRSNLRPDGKLPGFMQAAWRQHGAQMHNGGVPELFPINHDEIQRLLVDGTNVLTVQLHNNWIDAEMTVNPFLSFGIQTPEQENPNPPDWFYCDSLHLHTNFKLATEGESIFLFDPNGSIVDSISFPALQVNTSFGRKTDANSDFAYFPVSSPGLSNVSCEWFSGSLPELPLFSMDAGIYDLALGDSLLIELNSPDTGFTIRYTLDGSEPCDTSELYLNEIYMSENTVLKARLFKGGFMPGGTRTNTYIVNKETNLPIISLSTDPDFLWSDENGIYVPGPGASNTFPYFGSNFWIDKEIPANIEYFGEDKELIFEQGLGIKIHGGWSRAFPQKSLRLTARSCFGSSEFQHSFFADKNINDFKKLILRNGGNDSQSAMMRDPLIHKLVHQATNITIQDYLPTVVYLNGDYWGIHNMREKIDEHFLSENFDLDNKNVDLLEKNNIVLDGDNIEFLELYDFIINNNIGQQDNYLEVCSKIDITNLIDYFAIEFFIMNTDWPQNNVKYWKHEDGKWQYIMLDADNSMGLNSSSQSYSKEPYTRVLQDSINIHPIIFQHLLTNDSFKQDFLNRTSDLLNTIFLPDNSLAFIDVIKDSLYFEMEYHRNKWGGSLQNWANFQVDSKLKNFFLKRPEYIREHAVEVFDLDTIYNLHLETASGLGSHIRINSIIPDQYPWDGIYFDSIPLVLEALPAPGMEFSHWQTTEFPVLPNAESKMMWHLSQDDTLVAHFTGTPDTLKLLITEVNFDSDKNMDAGDWIEIYNPNEESMNLSGWELKSKHNFVSFVFPENTILPEHEYLILVQDTTRFSNIYPEILNWVGPFDFGLKPYAASIRLFDFSENLITQLNYSSEVPWPQDIAGSGRTIELVDIEGSLNDPQNWNAGCLGGSPGESPVACVEEFKIVFTEFNYASSPGFNTKDWVEVYNYDTTTVDLSFWNFKDGNGAHVFTFPYGIEIDAGGFLVICNDTADFRSFNPDVNPIIGNFEFGLSSLGDKLRLFEPYGDLVSLVEYSSELPWPQNVNGTGRTAEVIDYTSEINIGSNWTDACLGGSPGMFPVPCQDTAAIIVTEINYNSPDEYDTGDWFELFNQGDVIVSLNNWTFRDSDTTHLFEFPDGIKLEPEEYLIVVEDSSKFLLVHDTIPQFVGEFGFGLSSENDEIHITDNFGQEFIYINYQSTSPWPENIMWPGRTLELIDYTEPQNIPDNWKVGCFLGSPGIAYVECDDYSIPENGSDELSLRVYPNPFGNSFTIEINAKFNLDLELKLESIQGLEIMDIYKGQLGPELKTISFDGLNLDPGIYILQIVAKDFTSSFKLIAY